MPYGQTACKRPDDDARDDLADDQCLANAMSHESAEQRDGKDQCEIGD